MDERCAVCGRSTPNQHPHAWCDECNQDWMEKGLFKLGSTEACAWAADRARGVTAGVHSLPIFDALDHLVTAIKAWSATQSPVYQALKLLPEDFIATLRSHLQRLEEVQRSNQSLLLKCRELEQAWRPWPPAEPPRWVKVLRLHRDGPWMWCAYSDRYWSGDPVREPVGDVFYRERGGPCPRCGDRADELGCSNGCSCELCHGMHWVNELEVPDAPCPMR